MRLHLQSAATQTSTGPPLAPPRRHNLRHTSSSYAVVAATVRDSSSVGLARKFIPFNSLESKLRHPRYGLLNVLRQCGLRWDPDSDSHCPTPKCCLRTGLQCAQSCNNLWRVPLCIRDKTGWRKKDGRGACVTMRHAHFPDEGGSGIFSILVSFLSVRLSHIISFLDWYHLNRSSAIPGRQPPLVLYRPSHL